MRDLPPPRVECSVSDGCSQLSVDFPVQSYHGTKSVVISTVSWIGGKNPFLGWAYVAAAALFVLLAVLGTIRHMFRPRFVLVCLMSSHCMTDVINQKIGRHVPALVEPVIEVTFLLYVCILHFLSYTARYIPFYAMTCVHILLHLRLQCIVIHVHG